MNAAVAFFQALSLLLQTASGAPPARADSEPVAIVTFLAGKAHATLKHQRSEIKLFQLLRTGASVETGRGSKVVLAFATGERYELGENASGIIDSAGLVSTRGSVRKRATIPAVAEVAPIAIKGRSVSRSAGVRIRGDTEAIQGLFPSRGGAADAAATRLEFEPVDGSPRYKIQVETEASSVIYSVETPVHLVSIPAGVLQPGTVYHWRVQTVGPDKTERRGIAFFVTLSQEDARKRAALKAQAKDSRDPSLLSLLAEVDHHLGLEREACEEIRAALELSPGNTALEDAMQRLECRRLGSSARQ